MQDKAVLPPLAAWPQVFTKVPVDGGQAQRQRAMLLINVMSTPAPPSP